MLVGEEQAFCKICFEYHNRGKRIDYDGPAKLKLGVFYIDKNDCHYIIE